MPPTNDSRSEIERKFRDIIMPQIRPEMASTLNDFVSSHKKPSDSSVNYVLARLWIQTPDPRKGPE